MPDEKETTIPPESLEEEETVEEMDPMEWAEIYGHRNFRIKIPKK